jgi:rhodanese-related sulfurtransferase
MMLFLAGTAGAVLLLASSRSQAQSAVVTLEQARADAEAGRALLVDIREPDEHATGVAAGARLLPMSQLSRRLTELPKDRPVLLICNTQNRSRATFDALRQQGYTNLQFVQGGMSEWARRRWLMVAPSKVAPPTPAAR